MTVLYPWQTGVNGSNTAKINPNQNVSALIPLNRPQTEWPLMVKIN